MNEIREEWNFITSGHFIKLMLLVPILAAAFFGYLFQNGFVQEAPLAVVDLDHSTYSRQLIDRLNASQYIEVAALYDNHMEPDPLLYNEHYSGVLYLPDGLETAFTQRKTINLGLYLDMTMAAGVNALRTGVGEVIGAENAAKGMSVVLNTEQRALYNPTSATNMNSVMMYVNVIMLALLAVNTLPVVPRLRETGRLSDEWRTPLGVILRNVPYALICTVSFYLVIGVVKQVGHLRFEANWIELFVPLFLYSFSTCLMSMAVGWSASSSKNAVVRVTYILLPSFLLSGVQVPYIMMPALIQWINQLLPLSLHFKMLRGIGYKGGQLRYFIPELGHYCLIIALLTAIVMLLALRERKKRPATPDVPILHCGEGSL